MSINVTSVDARMLQQQQFAMQAAQQSGGPGAAPAQAAVPAAGVAQASAGAGNVSDATLQALRGAGSGAQAGAAGVTGSATPAPDAAAQQQGAQAERFDPPLLRLPARPTSRDVLRGLTRAMADPRTNATTAAKLKELHDMVFQADQAMTQVILEGVRS